MNVNCPSCGALYNVAEKDIGRKLKCKKCSSALKVTDEGLVLDGGSGSAPPVSDPKPAQVSEDDEDDKDKDEDEEDRPAPKKKKKGKDKDRDQDRDREPRPNPLEAINKIGGIPTVLFGVGVFFVIFFTFMEEIGKAAISRAEAGTAKVAAERDAELRALLKGKKDPSELKDDERKKYDEEEKKVREKYATKLIDAGEDARQTAISNVRSVWMERYGLMFGFMFLAFGCLGYLRTEQPLVLRIVAAVILAFMMMIVFFSFGGGCGGKSTPALPKGGGGIIPG